MTSPMNSPISPELLAKYGTRGPRYTSYPTAPHFSPEVSHEALAGAWKESSGDLSLYAHIPFCQIRCLFCACHVKVSTKRDRSADYVDHLLAELDLTANLLDTSRPLRQLQLGGGTPNFLEPDEMTRFIEGVKERFNPSEDSEWGIECDPRTVDPEYIQMLMDLGMNRFSFGVQDLDDDVMAAVGRAQSVSDVASVVAAVRSRPEIPLNLDLIHGLPKQTEESWARTLEGVLSFEPARIAVFGYAHVPWMAKHQTAMEKHGLPDSELRSRLASRAREAFAEAGYVEIGMDHFALPTDELALARADGTLHRNFMGYTTRRGLDLMAVGTSGISRVGRSYAKDDPDLGAWMKAIAAGKMPWERGLVLSEDDVLRGEVITELSCNGRLDTQAFDAKHGVDFGEYFKKEQVALQAMEKDGLLLQEEGGLELTTVGKALVRNVCMVFDAYLEDESAERAQRYSSTV